MTYLYAAYIATWVIHLAYIGTLIQRYQRVRREMQQLVKE